VASIANVASYLAKIHWDCWIFNERYWTIIMIQVAVLINLLIIYRRNMREFAAVGIWALFAIYIRHIDRIPAIAYVALAGAFLISVYAIYHAYVNRKTNPMYRLVKGDSEVVNSD